MRTLLLLCFSLSSLLLFAQETRDITDIMYSENWFKDLEKAKASPEKVFYLDLSLQKLKTFPEVIFTFKNLKQLYLPYNYWPLIPDEIGTLTNLEVLDLSGNYYLNRLPLEGLSKLKNLREFHIKDNKLVAGEVEKLKKLLPGCKVITE